MNMIRGDRIVQNSQGEPFAGFAQPGHKTGAVMSEFQQQCPKQYSPATNSERSVKLGVRV
jgi:hypothetical protein